MEQRISAITLGVKDLGVSKRFYADGLGWKPVYEDKEIVFFQAGGTVFALFLRDKLAKVSRRMRPRSGRAPMALAYNVRAKNEVDPLIQRAAAVGATILEAGARGGLGRLLRDISPIPTDLHGKWPGIPDGHWRQTAAWRSLSVRTTDASARDHYILNAKVLRLISEAI